MRALSEILIKNGYDVVCLQELWCDSDYKYLKQSCENVFKYIHYFHRYVNVLTFYANINYFNNIGTHNIIYKLFCLTVF